MYGLEISTKTVTDVTVHGVGIDKVLKAAADLAHSVLEELSVYRQQNDTDVEFSCEADACAFLDMIGD